MTGVARETSAVPDGLHSEREGKVGASPQGLSYRFATRNTADTL